MAIKKYKVASIENKPLSWWNYKRNSIDMNPPYQRKSRLWSNADKAYLIDFILNGYDIPKFYIADFTWRDLKLNEKNLEYAIIDGKQRFESIFDFYDGNLTLNDDFVYNDNPNIIIGGLSYKDLVNNYHDIAERFDTFPINVISVVADDEEPINELFIRLNEE